MPTKSRTLSLLRTLGSTAARASAEALRNKMAGGGRASAGTPGDDTILPALSSAAAERLVRGLDELKGAAMKFGQMLSLADDSLLPPGWKGALARLQSESTAKPFSEIEPLLARALPEWRSQLVDFEETALHAASIGQVHRARLASTGERVAVKIRYPDLEKWVRSDLQALQRMLRLASALPKDGDFGEVFDQVERVFLQEIDFAAEAEHYRAYRAHFEGHAGFVVPRVIDALSGEAILVTEWVEGVNVEKWLEAHGADRAAGAPLHAVSARVMELLFEELFVLRTIQTDPNPANFLVTEEGRIALLDFGATQTLDAATLSTFRDLSEACLHGTKADVIAVCERMGLLRPDDAPAARDAFVRMMAISTEPFLYGEFDFKGADLVARIKRESLTFVRGVGVRPPPPGLVFPNRRIVGTQMLLERLGGRFNARALLLRYIEEPLKK